ncbi:HD domain-containing protein [Actinomadura alba]|uniref:Bifunctional (P)ppGpp synthetase/guanosine-3',5'-bis(Diphosphate) 3'-pyrophosphohydrolase n=1 Tax=Actinomadura alba TaxID=406431 RepID=A0ABR7LIX2_9ACTN|nr:HD domain-containing protein [Actinomadura alba]MBC6464766.1 bifunctional (p)ppGpp synthetase/guanosine-3',5'-bis(diphosphate) 3'-pyrophosphohydrolase [Actinomadura alba]
METFTSWRTWDDARPDLLSAASGAYRPVIPVLDRAAAAAVRWHGDQLRPTGVPYVEHLLEALEVQVRGPGVQDPDVLVATLLHDVVEDTGASLGDVEKEFGPVVAELVDWVTKPPAEEGGGGGRAAKRAAKAAYLRRLRDAPREAILVKLADRVSNVQRLDQMPPDFQKRYYAETVTYVQPLAEGEPWFAAWFAGWSTHFGHLR